MPEKKVVIGITGRICSGKDVVADVLVGAFGAQHVSSSKALYDALDALALPRTRANVQAISTLLRKAFSDDILEGPIIREIEQSKKTLFVTSSLRRKQDYSRLAQAFDFHLVYIEASPDKRYRWFVSRPDKSEQVTYEEFSRRDCAESEERIEELTKDAYVLSNNGTLAELTKRALEFFAMLLKEKAAPRW